MGAFDGTLAHAAGRIACVDAVASIHDLCHKVTVRIEIACTRLGYAFAGRGEEFILERRQQTVYLITLLLGEGCAGIPLDAAFAEACVNIAAKELFRKIKRNECVLYL